MEILKEVSFRSSNENYFLKESLNGQYFLSLYNKDLEALLSILERIIEEMSEH